MAAVADRYEQAVDAVVSGDSETLRALLAADPSLIQARSRRPHHATLLHYVAANGVEDVRQKTPPNALEIATTLLDAGADPNALADMYDAQHPPLTMLVSSTHPAQAGLQIPLAELLLDRGAKPGGALLTALRFGFLSTARMLATRTPPADDLPIAAGLGHLADVTRLLPNADSRSRHIALSLAAQLGHVPVVRALLDAGEDPNRYNETAFHDHSTPLHQAVAANHLEVVRLLVERGARTDIADTLFKGTPLEWADYLGKTEIAAYLRGCA